MKSSNGFLKLTAFLVGIAAAMGPASASACGDSSQWAYPGALDQRISLEEAQKEFAERGFKIEKAEMQAMCGSEKDYVVTDQSDGSVIGIVPAPSDDVGRYIKARVNQLLETPIDQLKTLAKLRKEFYKDETFTERDFGFSSYMPNALPLSQQFPGKKKQLVYVTIGRCYPHGGYASSNQVAQIEVNTTEYIPGRKKYAAEEIYKPGDLVKALSQNPQALAELVSILEDNVKYCPSSYYYSNRRMPKLDDEGR